MSANQSFIDLVVARVLERLRSRSSDIPGAGNTAVAASAYFEESVLTEAILENRIDGATAIRIAPGTVLTPSARDYLRHRHVAWTRATALAKAGAPSSRHRLIVMDEPSELAGLAGSDWSVDVVSNVSEAVAAAIDSVSNCGAVVLAAPAEAIACEANRDQRVRAVAVCSLKRLKRAKSDLRPNVVCVDPNGPGLMELRNILNEAKG